MKKHTSIVTTGLAVASGLSCAMVLTAYSALSLVNRAFLPPSSAQCEKHCRQLDASVGASGPHGFAVRAHLHKSHPAALVPVPPRLKRRRIGVVRLRHRRVHHIPRPTSVTVAIRPSCGRETGGLLKLICPTTKAKYFCEKGWTGISQNCPTGKSGPRATSPKTPAASIQAVRQGAPARLSAPVPSHHRFRPQRR